MNKAIFCKGKYLGRDAILKTRFSKSDLDKQIAKERTKSEARSLIRCLEMRLPVPVLHDADLENCILTIEYINESVTVRNYLDEALNSETFNSENILSLAKRIGHTIGRLHENHIIHGDLTSSNMLITKPYEKSKIILIDFDMSSEDSRSKPKADDLYVLEKDIFSTHPNSEGFVESILSEYAKNTNQDSKAVIQKLDEVRQRG